MKRFALLFTSILLLVLFSSCVSEPELLEKSKVYIVSVGLDYTNTDSYEELLGCTSDAMDIGYCFEDIYNSKYIQNNLTLMLASGIGANESSVNYPTKENVIQAINNIDATEDDMIIFYFSGHARQNDDLSADLCLAKKDDGTETFLDMEELYNLLNSKGCACALILDTCNAGTAIEYSEKRQYFDYALKDFLTQENTNVSILASSHAMEPSYYEENDITKHGRFTLGLLGALCWDHEANIQRPYDTGNTYLSVWGSITELPERLTTRELYRDVMSVWDHIDPNNFQTPELSFSTKDIVIVPEVEQSTLPQIPETPQRYIAYVDGTFYETLEEALANAKGDLSSGKIYIIDNIELDHSVQLDTVLEKPIEIEFGAYTCKFTEEVEKGFVFTGVGKHEENAGTITINGGVFEAENKDCMTFSATKMTDDDTDDQGVYVTAVSIQGNMEVSGTSTINFVAVKKMELDVVNITDASSVTIQSGTGMKVNELNVSGTSDVKVGGGTITVAELNASDSSGLEVGGGTLTVGQLNTSGDSNVDISGGKTTINKTSLSDNSQIEISGGTTQFLTSVTSENPATTKIVISGEDTKVAASEEAKEQLENIAEIPEDFEITEPEDEPEKGQAGITIKEPEKICYGTISGSYTAANPGYVEITLVFKKTSGSKANIYYWYVNGKRIGSSNQATFTKEIEEQSSYKIKCEVLNFYGSSFTSEVEIKQ